MTTEKEATFTEPYVLPSLGKYNPEIPDGKVRLRMLEVTDEKKLLANPDDTESLDKVLKSCVVTPKELGIGKLLPPDYLFLLIKLRILSYGDEYGWQFTCPSCRKTFRKKVNLSTWNVINLDHDHDMEKFWGKELKPRICQFPFKLKPLRNEDLKWIETQKKIIIDRTGENEEDVLRLVRAIQEVVVPKAEDNNEPFLLKNSDFTWRQIKKVVEGLKGGDRRWLEAALDRLEFGIQNKMTITCAGCNNPQEVIVPLEAEFFRPKYTFDDSE